MMKKKLLLILLTGIMIAFPAAGCGNTAGNGTGKVQESGAEEAGQQQASNEDTEALSDEERAKEVADLIDAIYVQVRTDDTDELCRLAREKWDELTDAQKEMVYGQEADPDYFGRDTGDASLDDPLNGDDIGENEILAVSFGTSFNDSRIEDIGGIEKALAAACPDWSVRRAFTSQTIINHIQARDNEKIDNMEQALERAVSNGVKNLIVQPTHLMHGAEYDEMDSVLEDYADRFESTVIAEPLLGDVGSNTDAVNEDKKTVAEAVTAEAVRTAGYDTLQDAVSDGCAFVFLGHGTAHTAKISYSQMSAGMGDLSYDNVFIGTVEGEPEETSLENLIEKVKDAGYKKVVLRPLMVVAGDHANNDMAGDEDDSWKNQFKAAGGFESVECQIEGLGRIEAIKELYVDHTANAMNSAPVSEADRTEKVSDIKDGEYKAKFITDSSMFKVNEAYDDMGTLTVKDGKMTIHISLQSDHIVNLYPGFAEDAVKDGSELLYPVKDEVTYDDGTTETVNGFDVPVPYLDREFDLALIGTKGKWYDHRIIVEAPVQ